MKKFDLQTEKNFHRSHRYDRWFYLVMLVIIWAAILSGFIHDMMRRSARGKLHFPLIVHVHAAAFVGWLVLFTVQVLLIRAGNYRLHKKLGIAGAVLAGAMVVLGVAAGIVSEHLKYGTPDSDPAFLGVMFGDMLIFGIVVAAGIKLRKDAAAHKRLLLLATVILCDAGTGRWFSNKIGPLFGNFYWTYHTFAQGFLPFFAFQMMPVFVLILLTGLYDVITRGRLHKVFIPVLVLYLAVNTLAGWLYFSPEWMRIVTRMIGY